MAWLEYSKDPGHGGPGWGFGECLWAPRYRGSNPSAKSRWAYWDTLQKIQPGDRQDLVALQQGAGRRLSHERARIAFASLEAHWRRIAFDPANQFRAQKPMGSADQERPSAAEDGLRRSLRVLVIHCRCSSSWGHLSLKLRCWVSSKATTA